MAYHQGMLLSLLSGFTSAIGPVHPAVRAECIRAVAAASGLGDVRAASDEEASIGEEILEFCKTFFWPLFCNEQCKESTLTKSWGAPEAAVSLYDLNISEPFIVWNKSSRCALT